MSDTPRHSVSVAAAIFDDSGENVLLIKRRDNGNWEPPAASSNSTRRSRRACVARSARRPAPRSRSAPHRRLQEHDRGIVALVFTARAVTRPQPSSLEAALSPGFLSTI